MRRDKALSSCSRRRELHGEISEGEAWKHVKGLLGEALESKRRGKGHWSENVALGYIESLGSRELLPHTGAPGLGGKKKKTGGSGRRVTVQSPSLACKPQCLAKG